MTEKQKTHDYYKPSMLDAWTGWSKMQKEKRDRVRYSKTKDRVRGSQLVSLTGTQ